MATIEDVRSLGYIVGHAWGSADVEQQSLDEARRRAGPEAVDADAQQIIATATAEFLELTRGQAAWTPERRREHLVRLHEQTYRMIQERRDADVALYERSLAIANELPDAWAVTGPMVECLYVHTKPDGTGWTETDQQLLDGLADPDGHAEREAQQTALAEEAERAKEEA